MLGTQAVLEAMVHDFSGHLDLSGYDAVVGVHVWSSLIAAHDAERQNASAMILDCHVEFSPFPVFPHRRIDAYVGAGPPLPAPRSVRSRRHFAGLPVRSSFRSPEASDKRTNRLVVNGGSTGWHIDHTAKYLPAIVDALVVDEVNLLAPNGDSIQDWERALSTLGIEATMTQGSTDIGTLLRSSRWLVTKGGGTPVAEGLAAGCTVLGVPSGLPWEDEALRWLAANEEAVMLSTGLTDDRLAAAVQIVESQTSRLSETIRDGAASVWRILEDGCPTADADEEEQDLARVLREMVGCDDGSDPLALLSTTVLRALDEWLPLDG